MLATLTMRWTAALLVAIACVPAVLSSPLDLDTDAAALLLSERATGKFVGAACTTSAECYSKNCQPVAGTTKKTCQRQPFGGPCFENNNCVSRTCTSGKCAASPLNGPCAVSTDCANPSTTQCTSGVCTPRTGTTQYPQEVCSDPTRCTSGRCVSSLLVKDNYDTIFPPSGSDPKCDYLRNGESGCRTLLDCEPGTCVGGTCKLGGYYDPCMYTRNCAGICGPDGVCLDTPASGSSLVGAACRSNASCQTGRCEIDFVKRYVVGTSNPAAQVNYFRDYACVKSDAGGPCVSNDQCTQGLCANGICTFQNIGDACSASTECESYNCAGGQCALAIAHQYCTSNAICYSASCSPIPCAPGTPNCDPRSWCEPIPVGGTCRDDGDCDSTFGGAACTPADNICRLKRNYACSAGSQCLSGVCSSGKCQ